MSKKFKYEFGIIGTGNMAEAMLKGLIQSSIYAPKQLVGFDISKPRLNVIKKKYKINTTSSLQDVIDFSKIILLSVKPQQMAEVLDSCKNHINAQQIFITIAAGLDSKFYYKHLGRNIRLVRVMPNTPALINQGVCAFFSNQKVVASQKKTIHKILNSMGEVYEVKTESQLDAVTALSGSGPAFVMTFLQSMIEGGIKAGLSFELSSQLVFQTVIGSTSLAKLTPKKIPTLIKNVTSKGGTTEAGLKVLSKQKFSSIVKKCIEKAKKRSLELKKLKS